jgi:acetate kinase
MSDRAESVGAGFGEGLVTSLVEVRVIDTDEEFMIARSECRDDDKT